MSKTVCVVLSGCGFLDGSEITEAVLSLYFLEKAGMTVRCFAPNRDQMHVVDHVSGEPTGEVRNVLVESARIARGKIQPLSEASIQDFDALVMPGGYGMAKNLSSFALEGPHCEVEPELLRVITEAVHQRKPIVALCIAPAVLAAALRDTEITARLTIGDDAATAEALVALGCKHEVCPVDRIVVDEEHRLITAPAYMYEASRAGVGAGIEAAMQQLAAWLR